MSKKEKLIKKLADMLWGEGCHVRLTAERRSIEIYDEIRASILTPKVVALLKAIGNRPDFCGVCKWSRCIPISGDRYRLECKIQNLNTTVTDFRDASDGWFKNCPLLSSEELAELTE